MAAAVFKVAPMPDPVSRYHCPENSLGLRCAACHRWGEPAFPDNVDFERGTVVCLCGAPLSSDLPGRWLPRRPEVTDVRGYVLTYARALGISEAATLAASYVDCWRRAAQLRDATLKLYGAATRFARERGIIIADTKFEFGMDGDQLVLADEVLEGIKAIHARHANPAP